MVFRYELCSQHSERKKKIILHQHSFAHLSISLVCIRIFFASTHKRTNNNANARQVSWAENRAYSQCNGVRRCWCVTLTPFHLVSKVRRTKKTNEILNICGAGETRIDAEEGAVELFLLENGNSNNNNKHRWFGNECVRNERKTWNREVANRCACQCRLLNTWFNTTAVHVCHVCVNGSAFNAPL